MSKPWIVWIRETALLTTVIALVGSWIAPTMWPAWLVMGGSAWAHYVDAMRRGNNEK